jgi:hypothetical protein
MKLKLCTVLLTAVTLFTAISLAAQTGPGAAAQKKAALETFGKLPLSFEPTADAARFIAHSGRYSVAVGAREAQIVVTNAQSGQSQSLHFGFAHATATGPLEALAPQAGVTNYYLGSDPGKWRLGVKNYAKLLAQGVYPGIDVVYYGDHRRLEFDFNVAPKADPNVITLSFSGMDKLYKNDAGELVAEINGQAVRFAKPFAYQRIAGASKAVPVDYELASAGSARLRVGDYDRNAELIIDPVVSYALYLGGNDADVANGIAVDSTGSIYVTGETASSNFPNSPDPSNLQFKTAYDAYVVKYTADGTGYIYTAILGGSNGGFAEGNAIALDSSNQAYIVGGTNFTDLPGVPTSGYLNTLNQWQGGDSDAFISILGSDGTLLRTSYLGGNSADLGFGIAVDSNKNVIAVGETCSQNFPGYNAFETKIEECVAFITKLNNNLDIGIPPGNGASALSYLATGGTPSYFFSEFFGGQLVAPFPTTSWFVNTYYVAGAIIVDPNGNVQIASNSGLSSPALPSASTWNWATALKGTTADNEISWVNWGPSKDPVFAHTIAYGVALDPVDDIFVAGGTFSASLAPYSDYSGSGAWVLKVNKFGPDVYSTVLESQTSDSSVKIDAARAIAVDKQGQAYVTGTVSGAYLISSAISNAYQPTFGGGQDAFLVRMSNPGAIDYVSYLGGSGNDQGLGVAVDVSGAAYITGSTQSTNFPTVNALTNPVTSTSLTKLSGTKDAFISKFSSDGSALTFSSYVAGSDGTDIDQSNAVALNPSNNGDMFMAGTTTSSNFEQLNPIGYVGAQSAYMGNGDAFVVKISATTPVVSLSTSSVSFPDQPLNSASTAIPVTVTNTGGVALDFTSITVSGTNASNFSQKNNCGELKAAATCTINVTFDPTVLGGLSAYLVLTDNATNSPQTIALSGNGISGSGDIQLSATTLPFGNQQTKTTSLAQTLTVTNVPGNGTLTINSVTITGANLADFAITSATTCVANTVIAAGGTCTIAVTFTPTLVATENATLTINGSSSNSPQSVTLTGTGTSTNPTNADFTVTPSASGVSVVQGGSASFTLTITPVNGFNSSIGFSCVGPSGSTCSFSPSTIGMDGTSTHTVQLSIGTSGGTGTSALVTPSHMGSRGIFFALLPFSMMGLLITTRRRGLGLVLVLMVVSLAMGMVGCGAAGSSTNSGGALAPGTYPITVTATSTGTTVVTHTLSLSLNVSSK